MMPCLWDTFNEQYHGRDKMATAVKEIEEAMSNALYLISFYVVLPIDVRFYQAATPVQQMLPVPFIKEKLPPL